VVVDVVVVVVVGMFSVVVVVVVVVGTFSVVVVVVVVLVLVVVGTGQVAIAARAWVSVGGVASALCVKQTISTCGGTNPDLPPPFLTSRFSNNTAFVPAVSDPTYSGITGPCSPTPTFPSPSQCQPAGAPRPK
jgi:hypothetical protein